MIYSLESFKMFGAVAVCPAAMEVGSERLVRVAENSIVQTLTLTLGVQNYECMKFYA